MKSLSSMKYMGVSLEASGLKEAETLNKKVARIRICSRYNILVEFLKG